MDSAVLGLIGRAQGLARRFETTRLRRIADVQILYARKAVRDVCYLLININYFYSHK